MDSYEKLIVTPICIVSLVLCMLNFYVNYMTANMRLRKCLSNHYVLNMALYYLVLMIWVNNKPTNEREDTIGKPCNENATYFSVSLFERACLSLRYSAEYLLTLTCHWIFCALMLLYDVVLDVFAVNPMRWMIFVALGYVLLIIPTMCYVQQTTCDLTSCWNTRLYTTIMSWRMIILYTLACIAILIHLAFLLMLHKPLATSGPKPPVLKRFLLFLISGIMFGTMCTLHVVFLTTDIISAEVYESLFALTSTVSHFGWVVFTTWQLKVIPSIFAQLGRFVARIRGQEPAQFQGLPPKRSRASYRRRQQRRAKRTTSV
ncbi:PREDICTED: uncharacterized protein LOC106126491 [Papilio xuthus]|uniref:Uncharacterized protein LOC106126491 n=1 Tax=Papilio xuthus TaxID=66420 RepID=A0AAJ6ZUU8_PAPXU|nr:PREDICTED: uncharacterized protein LOC106126491 [Papilio xuthus]